MSLPIKNIAITDFEFTGLDPTLHEIIEVGVIVVGGETMNEITRFESKIKPEHLENASGESLAIAGYVEKDWENALTLHDALTKYLEVTKDCIFAAWCSPYDWIFLLEAFKKTGIKNPFGHRSIDLFTVAHEKLKNKEDITGLGLSSLCTYFGIPKEPIPHRAINGAQSAFDIYKKLRELQ
ncbi:MAG: 3'-5' exonuclease [Patescibacteria group bacterium]